MTFLIILHTRVHVASLKIEVERRRRLLNDLAWRKAITRSAACKDIADKAFSSFLRGLGYFML